MSNENIGLLFSKSRSQHMFKIILINVCIDLLPMVSNFNIMKTDSDTISNTVLVFMHSRLFLMFP